MNTSLDRILESLEKHQLGLCDDCLSRFTNVTPRQQVNTICNGLAQRRTTLRAKENCPICHSLKLVNRLPDRATAKKVDEPKTDRKVSESNALFIHDASAKIDQIRRKIVEMLNSVEGIGKREEGLAGRVSRMRDEALLPGSIACMMLTLNSLRNLMVYEGFAPGQNESNVIDSAWAAIQGWANTKKNA
ncbi:MAG: hypothetical protein WAM91_04695 [Candidatus Acidiferrales bacterium]